MKLLSDLLTTDYGLMSLIVIAVIAIAMIGFAVFVVLKIYQK